MTAANETPGGTAPAVIPIIVYQDIEAAHDYLVTVFGFASGGLHRDGNGLVVHGEVRMGDSPVWMHRVTAEHEMNSPKDASESHGGLEVIVPDVDAHFARAQAAGARIDRSLADQEYGRLCRSTGCPGLGVRRSEITR